MVAGWANSTRADPLPWRDKTPNPKSSLERHAASKYPTPRAAQGRIVAYTMASSRPIAGGEAVKPRALFRQPVALQWQWNGRMHKRPLGPQNAADVQTNKAFILQHKDQTALQQGQLCRERRAGAWLPPFR